MKLIKYKDLSTNVVHEYEANVYLFGEFVNVYRFNKNNIKHPICSSSYKNINNFVCREGIDCFTEIKKHGLIHAMRF